MVKEELESKERNVEKEKIALEMDAVVEISNAVIRPISRNGQKFWKQC